MNTEVSSFNYNRHRWLSKVARDKTLCGFTMHVAVYLWEHMNADRGYAWPSMVRISEQLGIDQSTTRRAIHRLEERGWITVERQCGIQRGNRYRMSFGALGITPDGLAYCSSSNAREG